MRRRQGQTTGEAGDVFQSAQRHGRQVGRRGDRRAIQRVGAQAAFIDFASRDFRDCQDHQSIVASVAVHNVDPGTAGQRVIVVTAVQRVGPAIAEDRVVAGCARQDVRPRVAGDQVRRSTSGTVQISYSGQGQGLDPAAQRVGCRAENRVCSAKCGFVDDICAVINNVAVIARAAGHCIVQRAAVQRVVAVATKQRVGAAATKQRVIRRAAGQRIVAAVAVERRPEAATSDDNDVVAAGAVDCIGRQTAVVQRQRVAERRQIERRGCHSRRRKVDRSGVAKSDRPAGRDRRGEPGQLGRGHCHTGSKAADALDIQERGRAQVDRDARSAAQRIAVETAVEHVARADCLGNLQHVGTRTGQQTVKPCAAIQRVVAVAAVQRVVAVAAGQRVCPGQTGQHVSATIAGQHVVGGVAGAVDRPGPGQGQVLEVGRQGKGQANLNRIDTAGRSFGHHFGDGVDDIGIVTLAAGHLVGAGTANHRIVPVAAEKLVGPVGTIKDVVGRVAGDRVAQQVAGGVDVRGPGLRQIFDLGSQCQRDRGLDRIGALACKFNRRVAEIVDNKDVVAQTTGHRVNAQPAIQRIAAVAAIEDVIAAKAVQRVDALKTGQGVDRIIAVDRVVQRIAGATDRACTGQGQVFKVVVQRPGDRADHRIRTLVQVLVSRVAQVIDSIGVVARAADHRVCAGAAIQHIGAVAAIQHVAAAAAEQRVIAKQTGQSIDAAVADQDVVGNVTSAIESGSAGQGQVFQLGRKGGGQRAVHGIGAACGQFGYHIASIINGIGVVARATRHRIRAGAAVQRIVPVAAKQRVNALVAVENIIAIVAGQRIGIAGADDVVVGRAAGAVQRRAGQGQIFDIDRQNEIDRAGHRVKTATGLLDDSVGSAVDSVAVVARAATGRIVAGAAIDGVVAVAAPQNVVFGAPKQRVVAIAAVQRVDTGRTRQGVVADVAEDGVGKPVAGAVDVRQTGQGQVFDLGGQRPVDRALHDIGAACRRLDRGIQDVIDDVDVVADPTTHRIDIRAAVQRIVAGTAKQRVIAGQTVQRVGADVAGQRVVAVISGTGDRQGAGDDQVFNVGRQRDADRTVDRVGALGSILGHHVKRAGDDIGIVVGAAAHRVGTAAAIERIVAATAKHRVVTQVAGQHVGRRVTGQYVRQCIADAVDHCCPGQGQVFDKTRQRGGDRCLHRIDAAARQLLDDIGRRVDDECVVAVATIHRVVVSTAIERVIAVATVQRVIACAAEQRVVGNVAGQNVDAVVAGAVDRGQPGQGHVLDVGRQGIGYRALHSVGAAGQCLGDGVGDAVNNIGIVVEAAAHRVVTRASVQCIVAVTAVQHIIVGTAKQCIAAQPAVQRIGAAKSGQHVGCIVAGQHVGNRVASAVDEQEAGQRQVFDFGTDCVVDRGLHRIGATQSRFDHGVVKIIHHVGIVADTAGHRINPKLAIQNIVAAATE